MSFLHQALVFLGAAVVFVPIFKKLGLGSVLGYLAAGVVIGPSVLRLIGDVESVLHVSEFGVVLLLFLIGLELRPTRLWELRKVVFGLGLAQVVITGAVLGVVAWLLGLRPVPAGVVGVGLSFSSTAFALQMLGEKNQLTSEHGRSSFGILLFQDLAVIPVLAILPLLGARKAGGGDPTWLAAAKVVGVLVLVFVAGRYVLRPIFRRIAALHSQELMTATALLVVVGTALLVSSVGLSMALGAFLAGVLLAESEYKHELEADLEPFKGLLLGLFFVAVGMSVDLGVVAARPLVVAGLVLGLVAVKAAILFALGRRAIGDTEQALALAIAIAQGGEFAFVLFAIATKHELLGGPVATLLVAVVSLSMAVTPFAYALHERVLRPRLARRGRRRVEGREESFEEASPVLIAGFGRVGQVLGRVLRARRIPFTALDSNPEHIDFIKEFGNKVHFGDASRLELLRAAGAEKAKIFVLAIDTIETSLKVAETVRQHFPHLRIYARARNRQHAYDLLDLGITNVIRDTFAASLDLTAEVLQDLGLSYTDSRSTIERFREHDEELLLKSHKHHHDVGKLKEMAGNARAELEQIFRADATRR